MIVRLYIVILIFLYSLCSLSQEDRLYIDFDDPNSAAVVHNSLELSKYASIYLKNTKTYENLDVLLVNIAQHKNINSIIITSYYDKKFPESLADCKSINKVTLLNCTSLNVKQFVKAIGKLPTLETINMGNCKVDAIPPEIKSCTQLRSINISMNNMLDLPTSITSLSECKNLESVSLPVNQISELPSNINLLTHLKELNLANNNLTDLPDEIGELNELTSISMQKNIIVSPLKTYEKLNPLNIKFLSIDEITTEELQILQERFPNAEILQTPKPSVDLYQLHQQFKDSIVAEIQKEKNTVLDTEENLVKKRESIDVKVRSLAYLHYAESFDPIINADYNGDTMLFDERYLDTNYYNVYRRQIGLPYDYFELIAVKSDNKNTIWFDFKVTEYFYYQFPEYFAFNDMSWVVINYSADTKEFKNNYLKNKKYIDFRLAYNSIEKNFNLQLKTTTGFEELTVIPKLRTKKKSTAEEQLSYEMRYIKYLESINNRRLDFDKELKEKRSKYLNELRKIRTKAWGEFSELYLSDEERSWTQDEWLSYYDNIIANENQALLNAQMDFNYLERYLLLNKFTQLTSSVQAEKQYGSPKLISFADQELKSVSVTAVYVIDTENKVYKTYKGSNAPMDFYLFAANSPLTILTKFRNGNFGMTKCVLKDGELITLDEYPASFTQLYDIISKIKML
ncbi:MAG: leucine-rich repeat domain-containing protein [Flavobacteriales bacterium]|nr:leucine-rich repeat domain-containing protein [Flavobacteriales bacterium]